MQVDHAGAYYPKQPQQQQQQQQHGLMSSVRSTPPNGTPSRSSGLRTNPVGGVAPAETSSPVPEGREFIKGAEEAEIDQVGLFFFLPVFLSHPWLN